ncbi:Smg-4/UPF3 family-domain-containing protein [Neurospora crassa]|nr:Smg-4/UPF3 family-domain-containing protein [Neurospora crassa]
MMAAPQLLLRKPNGTAAGQATNDAQNAPKTKPQSEGEKVVVRRLPPLLTEEEFFKILGDEWKVGRGKVDWFSYWPGKSSQHPSRPSRPSRAYFHVIRKDDLLVLSQAVQNGVWEDAKESYNDPVLNLPPTVELSIHKKIPSDKKRVDNRQGTIDQEPEFMAFLESLANPDAHKTTDTAGEPNAEETSAKPEKVTTTPLVEYLKEKKAQRAKEAALARSAKQHARQESQGGKTKTATATITLEELKKRAREVKGEKTDKVSEKPRDNVKILTRRGASSATAEAAKAANTVASQIQDNTRSSSKADSQTKAAQSSSQSATQSTPSGDATSELPKSRRAGIAAAARILQRDLGLSPGNAHRKARQEAAKAEADAKASAAATASANAIAAKETASREKKEKETTPAPASSERSSTPANAADSSAVASPSASARGRESASGRTRGRRGRGGTTEEGSKSKGTDAGKETKPAEVATPQPPIKPTMILKKRDSTQTTPSALSTPSTPVNAQPPALSASQKPSSPKQPSTGGRQRGGGRGGEAKENVQPGNNTANTPSTPAPTGPTQAFIKHAHQTQGVTESTLREALQAFGAINSIDLRKKGLAYVDFADPEALKKAIAASPVTIARASVTILERKSDTDKKEDGGKDKDKETAAPGPAGASALVEKEKTVPEKEKENEKEKAPEKGREREKRDDERRRGRGRGRGRDGGGGGGDKDKEKEKEKGEKGVDSRGGAKGDAPAGGAKEAVSQEGNGSDRPVSTPKAERGTAASASARPTSAQDKGEKDKENDKGEKGEGEKKGENRSRRRRGGRGRGSGDKDKEKDKDGGGGAKKAEGSGSAQAAPTS